MTKMENETRIKDPFSEARKELARARGEYIGSDGDITDEAASRYEKALRDYFTAPAPQFWAVVEKIENLEHELTSSRMNGDLRGNPELVWLAAIRADLVTLEAQSYSLLAAA